MSLSRGIQDGHGQRDLYTNRLVVGVGLGKAGIDRERTWLEFCVL